jgi:membrane protein DedA with SNARE-associated domain
MVVPVPSEAVMPFAGFLIAQGRWTWLAVGVWATAGSVVGSLASYWIGAAVGRPVLLRWGRFVGLTASHLDMTERWFGRWGSHAVLLCRFVPVVRHLVSLPAGAARMKVLPFVISTAVGAAAWNIFLAWVGFVAGERWGDIGGTGHWLDVAVLVLLAAAVGWWYLRRRGIMGTNQKPE